MYGLAAINAANGWMITVAGISIVFTGLLVLSTVLENLERVLKFWDNRKDLFKAKGPAPAPRPSAAVEPTGPPAEATGPITGQVIPVASEHLEAIAAFQTLAALQGAVFELPRLLETAEKRGLARPHSNLDRCLELGVIVELGGTNRGLYQWNEEAQLVAKQPAGH